MIINPDTKTRSFNGMGFRAIFYYFVENIFFKTNISGSIIGWIATTTEE
ncbi:Uncharacterised protein [Mycobacteroides abscessus subsp. abscessus]|nr:Uncharacterised protein [Mycobacteroides abscessus subsp. abscessus]